MLGLDLADFKVDIVECADRIILALIPQVGHLDHFDFTTLADRDRNGGPFGDQCARIRRLLHDHPLVVRVGKVIALIANAQSDSGQCRLRVLLADIE